MSSFSTLLYERTGRVARITLNRPQRGNSISLEMPGELARAVELADLDPEVHVIALSGNGKGFCGGYDLSFAELSSSPYSADGSPIDPATIFRNHDPNKTWDPITDYSFMSRNVRAFMSLFHCGKPVLCKVHGFCVAGGTDMALCSDILLIEDRAKIGYPPARVWGVPTTGMWAQRIGWQRARRLLFTGDCLSGTEAAEWGLALEAHPRRKLDQAFEALIARVAKVPINQLAMHKLMLNQQLLAQGLAHTQALSTLLDGIARHTPEGYAFQREATERGFRQAVRSRDEPFGDVGSSTYKGPLSKP